MDLGREGEGCHGGSNVAGYSASDEDKYRGGVPVTSQEGTLSLVLTLMSGSSSWSLMRVLFGYTMRST